MLPVHVCRFLDGLALIVTEPHPSALCSHVCTCRPTSQKKGGLINRAPSPTGCRFFLKTNCILHMAGEVFITVLLHPPPIRLMTPVRSSSLQSIPLRGRSPEPQVILLAIVQGGNFFHSRGQPDRNLPEDSELFLIFIKEGGGG